MKFIFSRLVKIIGNAMKAFFYLFHWIFPKKRFLIPHHSKPWLNSKKSTGIPRIIWQTNFTDRVSLPVYVNYLFNRLMAPSFEYCFVGQDEMIEFVAKEYPGVINDNFKKLQIGAAQADLWRLLAIYKYGGVYVDMDAHFIWPASQSLKSEFTEAFIKKKQGHLSNYFFASCPNSENIKRLIDQTVTNIQENTLKNVYDMTGPGVFNTILDQSKINTVYYKYLCIQGTFTNEHFQYIDRPRSKWTRMQEKIDIVRPD